MSSENPPQVCRSTHSPLVPGVLYPASDRAIISCRRPGWLDLILADQPSEPLRVYVNGTATVHLGSLMLIGIAEAPVEPRAEVIAALMYPNLSAPTL